MPEPLVLLPDPTVLIIDYLRSRSEVANVLEDRIFVSLPRNVPLPAVRITDLTAYPVAHHRADRVYVQLDCFDRSHAPARLLGRLIRAALVASAGYVHPTGVLWAADDLSVSTEADTDFEPPIFRAMVLGHLYVRTP